MTRVKIADLKDHLSAHLRAVERGAEVVVTDRDRPIARISPIIDAGRQIQVRPPTRDFSDVRDRERVPAGWVIDSTALLLDERGDR